jgi:hypothetical protein
MRPNNFTLQFRRLPGFMSKPGWLVLWLIDDALDVLQVIKIRQPDSRTAGLELERAA